MTQRWTKPRPAERHPLDLVECEHCSHAYPRFAQVEIIRHCREAHRAFYKRKWEGELANSDSVDPTFSPLPENGT